MRKVVSVLAVTLGLSVLAVAHGNLTHVFGTVVQITDHSILVKTADGSTKEVAFDDETHFLKGSSPATVKDLEVGSRVVIHAHKNGEKMHAAEVKIGVSTAGTSHP